MNNSKKYQERNGQNQKLTVKKMITSLASLLLLSLVATFLATTSLPALARPISGNSPSGQQDLKNQEIKYNVPFLLLMSPSDLSVAQLPMIDNGSISVVHQLSSLPDDESADANGIVRPNDVLQSQDAEIGHDETRIFDLEDGDTTSATEPAKKVNISRSSAADAREYEQMPSSSSASSASTQKQEPEFASLGKQFEWQQQQYQQIGSSKSDNNHTSNVFISGNSGEQQQQQERLSREEEEVKKKVSASISGVDQEKPEEAATRIGEEEPAAEKRPRRSNRLNDYDDGDHRNSNSEHEKEEASGGSVPESDADVTSARFGRSAADNEADDRRSHEQRRQLEKEVDERGAEEAASAGSVDEPGDRFGDGDDDSIGGGGDNDKTGVGRTEFSDFDTHMSLGYVFLTDTKGRIHKLKLSGFGSSSASEGMGNVASENDYTNAIDPLVPLSGSSGGNRRTQATSNRFSPKLSTSKKSPNNSSEDSSTGNADYDDANKVSGSSNSQQDDVTHEQSGRHPTISGATSAATTTNDGSVTSDSTSDRTTLFVGQQKSGKPRIIWSRRKHSLVSQSSHRSVSLLAASQGAYPSSSTSTGGRMRETTTKSSSLSTATTDTSRDEAKSEAQQMDGDDADNDGGKSGSQSQQLQHRRQASIESESVIASAGGGSSSQSGGRNPNYYGKKSTDRATGRIKTQIAVDWINNLLFVLDKYQLIVMDFEGNNELILIDDFNAKTRPIDIKLDPNNDFLFWLRVGKFHNTIYKLDLNILLAQTIASGQLPGAKSTRIGGVPKSSASRNGELAITSHHYAHPVITNLPKEARLFAIDHKHSRIYVPLPVAPTSGASLATEATANDNNKTRARDESEVFVGSSSGEFTAITHMNSTTSIGDNEQRDCGNSTLLPGTNQLGEILAYNLDGTDVGPFRSVGEKSHLPTLEDMQDFTLDSHEEYLYWLTNDGRELVEEYRTSDQGETFYTAQHNLEGKRYTKLVHFGSNQPVNRVARSNFRRLIDTLLSANSINRLTRDESNQLGSMLERQLPSIHLESSRFARNAPFIILGVTALVVLTVYLVYNLIFQQSPNGSGGNDTTLESHRAESISGSSITSQSHSGGAGGACDGNTSNGFFASSSISRWITNRPSTSGGSATTNPETPTYNQGTQHVASEFPGSDIGSANYNTSNAIDEHYRDRFLDVDTSHLVSLNLWPNNIMDMSNKLYVPVEVLQDEELASIRRVSIDQLEEHKAPLGEGHFGMVVQGTIRCSLAERTALLRRNAALGTPSNLSARLFSNSPSHTNGLGMLVPPSVSSGHGSSSTSSEFITANGCTTESSTNADYLVPKSQCDSNMSDYMLDQNVPLSNCDEEFNPSTVADVPQTAIKRPSLNMDTKLRVAIKKLKNNASAEEKKDFLHEAKLLASFDHPNIVHLIGICLDRGSTQIVMELMLGGDLIRYMQENAPGNEIDQGDLTEEDLYDICLDIVNGCCYLEELNYIHRDLAARNCLVSSRKREERVVKLADFGLARDIFTSKYYKKINDSAMPIKWMAPECLMEQKFTTMSDIWSFGVVMWEVMGYCQRKPYSIVDPFLIHTHLEAGNRLEKPQGCGEDMYRLMNACWQWDPKKRPTFQECRATLIEIKNNNINHHHHNGDRSVIV